MAHNGLLRDPALDRPTPKPLHHAKAKRKHYDVTVLPPAKAKGQRPRQRIKPAERKPLMGDAVFTQPLSSMWLQAGRR